MSKSEIRDLARTVVNKIIADLTDRRGLGNEWDAIDPATKAEIRKAWRAIVVDAIPEDDPPDW